MWPTKNKKNTISVTSTILVFFLLLKEFHCIAKEMYSRVISWLKNRELFQKEHLKKYFDSEFDTLYFCF